MSHANNLIKCRDCKHWKPHDPEYGNCYSPDTPPDIGWWDGVCNKLRLGITIKVHGERGSDEVVKSVETDGNFSCIYAERK